MIQERKIALLVDAENVSHHRIDQVMAAIKNNLGGLVTVKRIYADWTKPNLSAWKAVLQKYAFLPIQQYSFVSGKNSSDFALVIDAMDLLYQNDIDVFYIVSSDSDFTRLAMRIRESGKVVIGMGEKNTLESFVMACNDYVFFDEREEDSSPVADTSVTSFSHSSPIPTFSCTTYSMCSDLFSFVVSSTATPVAFEDEVGEISENNVTAPAVPGSPSKQKPSAKSSNKQSPKINRKLIALIKQVVSEAAESDGWAQLSSVSSRLLNKQPGFNVKDYGYNKFIKLIEACESSFLIDKKHLIKKKTKTIKRLCIKNK